MSDCERFEAMLERLIDSDLDDEALPSLIAHCASCEDCRGLPDVHRALAELGAQVPEPGEAELDRRQERVLQELRRERSRHPLRIAAIAAGVILPFLVGLLVGRIVPGRPGEGPAAGSGRLIEALGAEAASNRALADVEDSRFTYSNVSFRRVPGERLALAFDVTTHLELVEAKRSPCSQTASTSRTCNPP